MSAFSLSPGRHMAAQSAQASGDINGLPAGATSGHLAANYAMDPLSMFMEQARQEQVARSVQGLSQIVHILAMHHLATMGGQAAPTGTMVGQTPALTPSGIHSPFFDNMNRQRLMLQGLTNPAVPGMGPVPAESISGGTL